MSSVTSKIFELSGPKELYLKEFELLLNELGPQEIIAETVCSAISPGTETGAFRGANPLKPGRIYPRVMGYCNVAKVIHTGKEVSKFAIGDHILTFQSHRTAFKCPDNDFIIKLAPGADYKKIAPAYLYHLGYHSLITGGVKQGHHVAVIGIGVLGYTTSVMSAISGAVTFAFTNQQAPANLQKYGVHCLPKNDDGVSKANNLTNNTGIDVVINTSNSWADWLLALKLVNKGGTIVNLGFPGRDEPLPDFNPLDPFYVYVKNITIKALCHLNETDTPQHEFRFSMMRNLHYIIDMIQSGKLDSSEIISEEIPYTDLAKQYEKYLNRSTSLYTTILNW